LKHNYILPR